MCNSATLCHTYGCALSSTCGRCLGDKTFSSGDRSSFLGLLTSSWEGVSSVKPMEQCVGLCKEIVPRRSFELCWLSVRWRTCLCLWVGEAWIHRWPECLEGRCQVSSLTFLPWPSCPTAWELPCWDRSWLFLMTPQYWSWSGCHMLSGAPLTL